MFGGHSCVQCCNFRESIAAWRWRPSSKLSSRTNQNSGSSEFHSASLKMYSVTKLKLQKNNNESFLPVWVPSILGSCWSFGIRCCVTSPWAYIGPMLTLFALTFYPTFPFVLFCSVLKVVLIFHHLGGLWISFWRIIRQTPLAKMMASYGGPGVVAEATDVTLSHLRVVSFNGIIVNVRWVFSNVKVACMNVTCFV
jgi:hypothetical protein